jgi:hypothetical protein
VSRTTCLFCFFFVYRRQTNPQDREIINDTQRWFNPLLLLSWGMYVKLSFYALWPIMDDTVQVKKSIHYTLNCSYLIFQKTCQTPLWTPL